MARGRREGTPEAVIREKRQKIANREMVFSFFQRLLLLLLLLWIVFTWVFGIMPMPNDDMSPRISARDLLLFYRLDDSFTADDVVVVRKDGTTYVGRVVAKPGDTVEVTDSSELKINGSFVSETDIYYSTPKYDDNVAYPLTLGEEEYFILCDYREGAKDSRYFGAVHASEIEGKVITVIRRSEL